MSRRVDPPVLEPMPQGKFAAFAARSSPVPAFAIRAATSCAKCGSLYETIVFLASSQKLTPSTIVEASTTTCPRCKTLAPQAVTR